MDKNIRFQRVNLKWFVGRIQVIYARNKEYCIKKKQVQDFGKTILYKFQVLYKPEINFLNGMI